MTTTSLPSQLTDGQSIELVARAGRAGLKVEDVKRLLGDDGLMRDWVRHARFLIESGLVHGRYTATDKILDRLVALLSTEGRQISDFVWIGEKKAPVFTDNAKEMVALKATLGTYAETMDFHWGQLTHLRPDCPWVQSEHTRIFRPYTLEWVRLRALHSSEVTEDILFPIESLCALAQHQVWIKQKADGTWLIDDFNVDGRQLPIMIEIKGGTLVARDMADAMVRGGSRFLRV